MLDYKSLFKVLKLQLIAVTVIALAACSAGSGDSDDNAEPVTFTRDISWVAPSLREDSSTPITLSEIDGYRVYYGTAAGDYQLQIDIDDSSITGYTLNLYSGVTWYVVMTTLDTDGRESLYSDEIIITPQG